MNVVIVGAGPIGLATLLTAQFFSPARIIMIDQDDNRLKIARQLGATDTVNARDADHVKQVRDLTDGGVDYAFSAVTSPAGLVDAIRMCAYAGVATLVGVPPPGRALEVDLERDLFWPKVAVAVTHGGDTLPQEDFPFLAHAALAGQIDLQRFVTSTIGLEEVPAALEALHRPTGVRTVAVL